MRFAILCTVVMQETAHQSPVFDCSAESSAGQTEVRDGEPREKEEESSLN